MAEFDHHNHHHDHHHDGSNASASTASKILWTPSADRIAQSNLKRFMDPLGYEDYDSLHKWSCNERDEFWDRFWDFSGMIGDKVGPVSEEKCSEEGYIFENTRFFPNSRINFTENILRRSGPETAITFCNEIGGSYRLSFDDLRNQVSSVVQYLQSHGIREGDRVAGYIPNQPEAVVTMLATACIGAIWTSCSPDFGVQSVYDRLSQTEPKILIAATGYFYAGKNISMEERVLELNTRLPSIKNIIVVGSQDHPDWSVDYKIHDYISYSDLLAQHPAQPLQYERFDFNIPMLILYSSGTTGMPKCIVHGAGGTLITHMKEHQLQCDIKPGDNVFYFTTCGWMMWNWLVSALASGASIVLYDGSPLHPHPGILFDWAEKLHMTFFGVSAKYFSALEKAHFKPTQDLSCIRCISSTGSPLTPESFEYIYNVLKKDVHLMSISGGTDIVSCFFISNPIGSVRKGELQCAGLAYKMEVFCDEIPEGEPGKALDFDQQGELVCTMPFPSQPLFFWSDFDPVAHVANMPALNYHKAYFNRYAGAWHHGDRIEAKRSGGFIIHGRSDAILNPGGVRIGTGEIYRQVEQIAEVVESLAIAQTWFDDVRIILFVILKKDVDLTEEMVQRIKVHIRKNTTPRHVPAKILQVQDLPRTKNGKLAEIAARNCVNGVENTNLAALANPCSLDYIRSHSETLSV